MAEKLPLNGTKTHPLKNGTLTVLHKLDQADIPASEVNPGVKDRLARDQLATLYAGPSPYKTVKGTVSWLRITDAGRAAVRALPGSTP